MPSAGSVAAATLGEQDVAIADEQQVHVQDHMLSHKVPLPLTPGADVGGDYRAGVAIRADSPRKGAASSAGSERRNSIMSGSRATTATAPQ
jgi:hypothetical protein